MEKFQIQVDRIIIIEKKTNFLWGFAYLRPRTEKVIKEKLLSLGIIAYLPMIPKARIHHSTRIITDIPMIPSYIFLCINDMQRSELLRQEKHIVHIELCRENVVEDQLIRDLNLVQRCEIIARNEPIIVNPEIVVGDQVIITKGELKGLETTVCRRDDEHNIIIINLTILNKHIEYPVSTEKLKKIAK